MSGLPDDHSQRWQHDRLYRRITDDKRVEYESRGNLSVQTVILLTMVEGLMEKTNNLLERLNATMDRVAAAFGDEGKPPVDAEPTGEEPQNP